MSALVHLAGGTIVEVAQEANAVRRRLDEEQRAGDDLGWVKLSSLTDAAVLVHYDAVVCVVEVPEP